VFHVVTFEDEELLPWCLIGGVTYENRIVGDMDRDMGPGRDKSS
jgi:hypothetical protein